MPSVRADIWRASPPSGPKETGPASPAMHNRFLAQASCRAATILRQRGADDRFSSSALPRAETQEKDGLTIGVCGEAALCYRNSRSKLRVVTSATASAVV